MKDSSGLTLSEIIVVVAILGLLIILAMQTIKPSYQLAKARDERRVADLKKISTALEDYAGDKDCYPDAIYDETKEGCYADQGFGHYLKNIPCDPLTKEPYPYEKPDDACNKYVVYATLELEKDITYGLGNYALASPNLLLEPTLLPTSAPGEGEPTAPPSEPSATPTFAPGETRYYGCVSGECTLLEGPPYCQPNFAWNAPCQTEDSELANYCCMNADCATEECGF